MIAFANQADLEARVGGADVLAQLADPSRSGTPDADLIDDWLRTGAARVRAALEVKHDPEVIASLDSDTLRFLKDINAALSARDAYEKGGKGMAMPPHVADAAARAEADCDKIALGQRRLGRVAGGKVAAINQPAGTVDFDRDGDGGRDENNRPQARFSREGFLKGFR